MALTGATAIASAVGAIQKNLRRVILGNCIIGRSREKTGEEYARRAWLARVENIAEITFPRYIKFQRKKLVFLAIGTEIAGVRIR